MKQLKNIKFEINGDRADVWLNRPAIHNAVNPEMIEELHHLFLDLEQNRDIIYIVLSGEGSSFCAGADIKWLVRSTDHEKAENWQEFLLLAELLKSMALCSKITIAAVHNHVLGGANGLMAACDFAVSAQSTVFAFGEVKLGIIPATILPFVARRVSTQNLKKLMFTGEPFGADHAQDIGLVDFVAADKDMKGMVDRLIDGLKDVSPNALKTCKQLIMKTDSGEIGIDSGEYTAAILAGLVHTDQGREGLHACLEKRKPDWKSITLSKN